MPLSSLFRAKGGSQEGVELRGEGRGGSFTNTSIFSPEGSLQLDISFKIPLWGVFRWTQMSTLRIDRWKSFVS